MSSLSSTASAICSIETLAQGKYVHCGYGVMVSSTTLWTTTDVINAREELELYSYRVNFRSSTTEAAGSFGDVYGHASLTDFRGSLCDISFRSLPEEFQTALKSQKKSQIVVYRIDRIPEGVKPFPKIQITVGQKTIRRSAYFLQSVDKGLVPVRYVQVHSRKCDSFLVSLGESTAKLTPGAPLFNSQGALLGLYVTSHGSYAIIALPRGGEEALLYGSHALASSAQYYLEHANHSIEDIEPVEPESLADPEGDMDDYYAQAEDFEYSHNDLMR